MWAFFDAHSRILATRDQLVSPARKLWEGTYSSLHESKHLGKGAFRQVLRYVGWESGDWKGGMTGVLPKEVAPCKVLLKWGRLKQASQRISRGAAGGWARLRKEGGREVSD